MHSTFHCLPVITNTFPDSGMQVAQNSTYAAVLKQEETMKSCGDFERIVELSQKDEERAAKFVARSFYRILRRNGFTQNQIINVASHLLDGLIQEMNGSVEQESSEIRNSI